MSLLMELHRYVVGNVFFPGTQLLYNRRGILAACRRSLRLEQASQQQAEALQLQRMLAVVHHAAQWTDFYRDRFGSTHFNPRDIQRVQDIALIPPLTRDEVIGHRESLVDRRFGQVVRRMDGSGRPPGEPVPFALFRKRALMRNTSSGSTGAPTQFYDDGTVSATSWSNELRLKKWYGIRPGDREARLVRITPDFNRNQRANVVRRLLWNQQVLPGVNLDEAACRYVYEQLSSLRPEAVWAFTSAITEVARYMQKTDCTGKNKGWPALIITWAAPLYPHERALLEEVFRCPVTNIYGMREVGHIGGYCEAGALHVFQDTHYVETDASGELLVTFLRPTAMPFIRYRTGDLGTVVHEQCSCGRTLPIIKDFNGRTGELFVTEEGRMFSPNFWCRTFMHETLAKSVRRFQIVYETKRLLRIRMVIDEGNRGIAEALLRQTIVKNFGAAMEVVFDYVQEIPPQISGKYQMVVNKTG